MFLEDAAHDREAEAGAGFGVHGVLHPEKALEDPLLVGSGDTAATVGDLDPQPWQGRGEGAVGVVARPAVGIEHALIGPGIGPQPQGAAGRSELQGVAHQVVEHLQQQVPVAQHPGQLGIGIEAEIHPLFTGIEAVGAQGLLDRRTHLEGLQFPDPVGFEPGEVEHVVHQSRQPIGFGIGNAEELLFLLIAELVVVVVQGFNVALDVEQGRAQFMRNIADETALGGVQFHLPGQVLDRHRDALEHLPAGIPHRLQHDPQGARRLPEAAAHIGALPLTADQVLQGTGQLHRQPIGKHADHLVAFEIAGFPAEQTAGGGIHQHDAALGIEEHRPIGHGGDQRLLLDLLGPQFLDIGGFIHLQLGGHRVETLQQFAQFTAHWQGDAGVEVTAGD